MPISVLSTFNLLWAQEPYDIDILIVTLHILVYRILCILFSYM